MPGRMEGGVGRQRRRKMAERFETIWGGTTGDIRLHACIPMQSDWIEIYKEEEPQTNWGLPDDQ